MHLFVVLFALVSSLCFGAADSDALAAAASRRPLPSQPTSYFELIREVSFDVRAIMAKAGIRNSKPGADQVFINAAYAFKQELAE